ncbi:DUF1657 domain-containing protein [Metabacillus sediminilitoris]|uniref:DUF1657 domain-containing protein n=1 Tax=Metabacillus sediminilitoris TaxID=2567941 RepID=A0A4S4BX86_9BACI|nr:DUF1657 domain-containing protein [Metabacillus sediminilitoris]QGQ46107.1 DUF1657 domain-containing protein [Metabacillus sediminilitoris]THF79791.1 DUF1657 domain-containing protein [Metabacillus sediminilitoris]
MTVGAQVKQCLSTVKGIEASLSSLAITSQDEDAKRTFHEMMMVMAEVKEDLKIRVGQLEMEEFQYKGF